MDNSYSPSSSCHYFDFELSDKRYCSRGFSPPLTCLEMNYRYRCLRSVEFPDRIYLFGCRRQESRQAKLISLTRPAWI